MDGGLLIRVKEKERIAGRESGTCGFFFFFLIIWVNSAGSVQRAQARPGHLGSLVTLN